MKLVSFGASDIGLARLNNEDVWAQLPKEQFFILADGMGGHRAGEVAAKETVHFLCHLIEKAHKKPHTVGEWVDILKKGISRTNQWILKLASEDRNKRGMGTTLCLSLIVQNILIYAHVGDSRIYRIRKGRIKRMTKDHSLKDELIEKGELDESLARDFPYKNIITRAIGTHRKVSPEIQQCRIEPSDIFFLCSDGVTDILSDEQILDKVKQYSSLQDATKALILEAKKRGGEDNITLLMYQAV